MLSDEQVKKYQTLYRNRFGKEISYESAYEEGMKLVRLLEVIYKPINKKDYQRLQERRQKVKELETN